MTSSRKPQERSRPRASAHRALAPPWHRWQWLAAVAAVALVVSVVGVYLASGHTGTAAGSPKAATSASSSTSSIHHAAIIHHAPIVSPELVFARIHVPLTLAAELAKWGAGPGGSALAEVSDDLGNATQDAGIQLYDPMKTACQSLAAAVTAAKAAPPIPDAIMQRSYDLALARLATAATDCRAGISVYPYGDEDVKTYENPTLLHQSVSGLVAGAKDLYRATVDINAIHHHGVRP